jgi:hypothetical protein
MVCSLELESSPELREAELRGLLVNLSGKAGAFTTGDTLQEFFNRLLEAVVDRKGAEFGDNFIRNIISRNLHHFARIKLDLRAGVGLTERSGRHKDPHTKPEVVILLEVYRKAELHRRRPGRAYNDKDTDNFTRGINKLRRGTLAKWIADTTSTRGLNITAAVGSSSQDADLETSGEEGDSSSGDENEDIEDETEGSRAPITKSVTMGLMQMVDGELLVQTTDFADIDDLFGELDGDNSGEEDD